MGAPSLIGTRGPLLELRALHRAIAAGVLTLIDLPQPTDYGAEGYRVLWTDAMRRGIGVLVMLLAGLLGRRTAKAPPPPPVPQPA